MLLFTLNVKAKYFMMDIVLPGHLPVKCFYGERCHFAEGMCLSVSLNHKQSLHFTQNKTCEVNVPSHLVNLSNAQLTNEARETL